MLKVTNIQKSFNGNQVLKGIDFDINKGEVVAILGPSGSGKTTFLRCLNLLERPEQGVLEFSDGSLKIDFSKKISKADELKLRRRSSMVFQQYHLFPERTGARKSAGVVGKGGAKSQSGALSVTTFRRATTARRHCARLSGATGFDFAG